MTKLNRKMNDSNSSGAGGPVKITENRSKKASFFRCLLLWWTLSERLQHILRTLSCFSESTGHPASESSHWAATESTTEPRPLDTGCVVDSSLTAHQATGFFFKCGSNEVETRAGLNLFFLCSIVCCRSCYLSFSLCTSVLVFPCYHIVWDSFLHTYVWCGSRQICI